MERNDFEKEFAKFLGNFGDSDNAVNESEPIWINSNNNNLEASGKTMVQKKLIPGFENEKFDEWVIIDDLELENIIKGQEYKIVKKYLRLCRFCGIYVALPIMKDRNTKNDIQCQCEKPKLRPLSPKRGQNPYLAIYKCVMKSLKYIGLNE